METIRGKCGFHQQYFTNNFNKIYFTGVEDVDIEQYDPKKSDPEYFMFDCLTVEDVEKLLNESVECLSNIIKCAPSLAKIFLLENKWCLNEIVLKYKENAAGLLVSVACEWDKFVPFD